MIIGINDFTSVDKLSQRTHRSMSFATRMQFQSVTLCVCVCGKAPWIAASKRAGKSEMNRNRIVINLERNQPGVVPRGKRSRGGFGRLLLVIAFVLVLLVAGVAGGGYL